MIFRRLQIFLVYGLLALALLPPAVSAQPAAQWQALVYDSSVNQLVSLNPNGIGAILILPPQLGQIAQQAQADGGITPVAITADHHYVAVQLAHASGLIFADLWTQTCCQPIANLLNQVRFLEGVECELYINKRAQYQQREPV